MGASLVTLAEYKAYAGISSTNSDAKITGLIPQVSALVKTICRRTFIDYVSAAKIEYHEGGADKIVPEEYPVLAITTLEYSSDAGATYTPLVDYTDFALSKSTDNIVPLTTSIFPFAINGYKLTYTAGFTSLPEELKLALFDLITYYMKNDAAIHSNKAPGTNTVQIEYVLTTSLPAHIKRVLDLYTANYN